LQTGNALLPTLQYTGCQCSLNDHITRQEVTSQPSLGVGVASPSNLLQHGVSEEWSAGEGS